MPLIIVTLIIAAVAGTFAPPRLALAITGVAAAVTLFAFVWAVADGQGNDPWWLIGVALVGCAAALKVADALSSRGRRQGLGA